MTNDKDTPVTVLDGMIAVRAAIESHNRPIHGVYVDSRKKAQRDRKTLAFLAFLKDAGVPVTLCPREEILAVAARYGITPAASFGGVIALVGERTFPAPDQLLSLPSPGALRYYVYLDGIEDPFNLAYAIRSFYALGACGLFLPERDLLSASPVLARSSAGAYEKCPIAFAPHDDADAVSLFCEAGLKLVCSALSARSVPLHEFAPASPFVLFIGGEKRGISPVFMEHADTVVHVPYARNERYSLPASSVCAMYASHLYPFAAGIR